MKVEDWTSVAKDMKATDIKVDENEWSYHTHYQWGKNVRLRVKNQALKSLVEENNNKEKTKHIKFKELNMSEYLRQNQNTQISKDIFFYQGSNLGHNSLV